MSLNLTADLKINPDELDVELLRQPEVFGRWAALKANALSQVDSNKNALEMVRCELAKSIRNNPSKYGMDKITEGAVQETIVLQKGYQAALGLYMDSQHDYEVAKAAVDALYHKKEALENLVRLFAGEYFSGPKAIEQLAYRADRANSRLEQADEKMQTAIKRRRLG